MKATSSTLRWNITGLSRTSKSTPFRAFDEAAAMPESKPPRQSTLTMRQWIDAWLDLCTRRGLRPSTVESYRTMLALYLGDACSTKPLPLLTARDLNDLYARLLIGGRRDGKGGLSARTVRYLHTILNKSFRDAVRAGRLTTNPAAAADPPSARAARARVFPVWTPAELSKFLESAKEDPHYVAFYVAAATGLRRGELLGLRWCDVDDAARELHVVQAVVEVAHEARIAPPKTDRSRRLVALDVKTAELLVELRAESAPIVADHSLVFSGDNGAPIHPAVFSYYFQRRVRLAGVRRIRLHDLRHTHATHALRAGVHPKVVSERLGHSTITITLDTYSHVLPSMQREAAEAVAALLHQH